MTPIQRRTMVVAFLALLLGACADGGGETGTGADPNNPRTETVHAGVISGFGSIFVNGIEFGTRSSRITLNGVRGTEHDLAVGMIVSVRGTVDAQRSTGTASRVQYTKEIDGVVLTAAISAVSERGMLNVMGRTVMIDDNTVFDSMDSAVATVAEIPVGGIVEVSGHGTGDTEIHATRIALKTATYDGRKIDVKGVITNVTDDSFDLGTLRVSYAMAGTLTTGWYVEVHSTLGIVNNQLVASSVTKLADSADKPVDGSTGEGWTGQGIVTRGLVDDTFVLNGATIRVFETTHYVGGTSTDLVLNRRVNAEGTIDTDGTVRATRVEIVPPSVFGMDASVQGINTDTSSLVLIGSNIRTDAETIFKDDRDAVRNFWLFNIATGDRLEIQFVRMPDGSLYATKVERTRSSIGPDELSGPIQSASGMHSVAGIPVTFICAPKCTPPPTGTNVELEGSWTGAIFNVTSFEREDD